MLEVNNLNVRYNTPNGVVYAVTDLSFKLAEGRTLGIVGESGSGKSQAMMAIMGILAKNAVVEGSVKFLGQEILHLPFKELNKIRGSQISMIFQDHMTSLNPYISVQDQMCETLTFHQKVSYKQAKIEAIKMLELLRIPDAKTKIKCYPHEFSGGMRQRVMIAMSLLCKPKILIADEPTTALDVTIQAQIINLLKDIKSEINTSIILITHDLGVISGIAEDVLVMYGGQAMEMADAETLYSKPVHPYTIGLLNAIPRIEDVDKELIGIPGSPRSKYHNTNCCSFYERCFFAIDKCKNKRPLLQELATNKHHHRACFVDYEKIDIKRQ